MMCWTSLLTSSYFYTSWTVRCLSHNTYESKNIMRMLKRTLNATVLLVVSVFISFVTSTERELVQHLLENYSPSARPVKNVMSSSSVSCFQLITSSRIQMLSVWRWELLCSRFWSLMQGRIIWKQIFGWVSSGRMSTWHGMKELGSMT